MGMQSPAFGPPSIQGQQGKQGAHDGGYLRELQIENGKFRQGIVLRNKKIKLLEKAIEVKDQQLQSYQKKLKSSQGAQTECGQT